MRKLSRFLAVLVIYIASFSYLNAQLHEIPGQHLGSVTGIAIDEGGLIFSVGEDGFLTVWNNNEALERIQLSPYSIRSIILRPERSQFCILESDGFGTFRISAWDYQIRQNLFTLRFSDPINSINYSAAGSFLIAAMSGSTGAILINGDSGEILQTPNSLSGSIMLGATGRSERNMISYLSSGQISYWDLETGNSLQQFSVLPSVRNPFLFGNNRFLGGFDSQGLVVIDTVTGQLLARDISIQSGILFTNDPGGTRFSCLTEANSISTVYQMDIDPSGRLLRLNQRFLPSGITFTAAISTDGENFLLGTRNGELYLSTRQNTRRLINGTPLRITELSASSSTIAFITERNQIAFIPLDYSHFSRGNTLFIESIPTPNGVRNELSSDLSNSNENSFLLWQSGSSLGNHFLLNSDFNASLNITMQNRILPIRSAAMYENRLLFLDTGGTVSIIDTQSGEQIFSFSVYGSMDAAFINHDMIIISRIASQGNSPFLLINTVTGETVPLVYPGILGLRVYRGQSGSIYGAVVNQNQGGVETSIVRLNLSHPSYSEKLLIFSGEDSDFYIAESGGNLASNMGDRVAAMYMSAESEFPLALLFMERSRGLTEKIIGTENYFISLDGEGIINWYDNQTGRLLASFRLQNDLWVLDTYTENGISSIEGRISLIQ